MQAPGVEQHPCFRSPLREIALHPFDRLARKLAAQSPLGRSDIEAIRALPCSVRTVQPNVSLLREGDRPDQCGILIEGFTYRYKTAAGARQIVGVNVGGDPLDFQSIFLAVADHSIHTLTRAEVALVPRDDLRALIDNNAAVARAVLTNALVEASIFREWILNVGRRSAKARLAHLLCELADRLTAVGLIDHYRFDLPMTQEQLGDTLGLTTVHVNRMLRALVDEGLIERDRRSVTVRDWGGLREAAGYDPRYLHLDQQKFGGATKRS
jgi:CRP-like cAMP-binding protein